MHNLSPMKEITYEKVGFFDVLSKIGGLYKILSIFLSFFSGTAFTMFIIYLSKKYSETTKELKNKEL